MQEQDLVTYLKSNEGYTRIVESIIRKYKSLGKLGGSIVLDELTESEVKILAPYDYRVSEARSCKISIKKFAEGMCAGKFQGADFETVLRLYVGSKLCTHKEIKQQQTQKTISFYEKLEKEMESTKVRQWVKEALAQKKYGYYTINKLYGQAPNQLRKSVLAIDALARYLNTHSEWILLPVLALKITSDTHYFDLNKTEGKLLLYFLSYQQGVDYPENLQEINEVLFQAKIERDQISNSTICYGVYGKTTMQDKPWEAFWQLGEPLSLSLYNIRDVVQITAMHQKVYIVENPAVFARLLDTAIEKQVGLICTSGQINTSSYMILDLLVDAGTTLYYNGDFDPEGLQIADKLKQRYKDLILWGYDIKHYEKSKGNVEIEDRLIKLHRITSKELEPIMEKMKISKVAGYQESLIEELIKEMDQ